MRFALLAAALPALIAAQDPFIEKQDVFPLDARHNHSSSLVELPNGDLLVCWYRGSGERTADDVIVMGARKKKGAREWTAPFLLADTADFPDTNPTLFVDNSRSLWLFWQAIVANQWETAITRYQVSSRWRGGGAPQWTGGGIVLIKPANLEARVNAWVEANPAIKDHPQFPELAARIKDNYFIRMGWMNRIHPLQLASGRILMPLYSDGLDFSLVAISDDGGKTWKGSEPIVGAGAVQPAFTVRRNGGIVAWMRDNGPAPKRVLKAESADNGETWTFAEDTDIPNPGSSVDAVTLPDGRWLLVYNDTEGGRNSLAAAISDDEGRSWKWKRHIELDPRAQRPDTFHYPSVIVARDGNIMLTYSFFRNEIPEGQPRKTIRFARFNAAWVQAGNK
jgi:predicted neuraminidase